MPSTARAARAARTGQALTAEQILLLDAAVVGGAGLALLTLRRPVAALLAGGGDNAAASGAPIVVAAGGVFAVYALAVAAGVKGGQTARVLPAVAALNSIWVAARAVQVLLSLAAPKRTPLQPASGDGVAVSGGVSAPVAWFVEVQLRLLRGTRWHEADRAINRRRGKAPAVHPATAAVSCELADATTCYPCPCPGRGSKAGAALAASWRPCA